MKNKDLKAIEKRLAAVNGDVITRWGVGVENPTEVSEVEFDSYGEWFVGTVAKTETPAQAKFIACAKDDIELLVEEVRSLKRKLKDKEKPKKELSLYKDAYAALEQLVIEQYKEIDYLKEKLDIVELAESKARMHKEILTKSLEEIMNTPECEGTLKYFHFDKYKNAMEALKVTE